GLSKKADPHGANGSDACSAQQHNLLSYLPFFGKKTPKNTLLKVRNVGYKRLTPKFLIRSLPKGFTPIY
ncbi:MAG: hypothetical protein ABIL06_00060, partial [Pseudomonadota bacterium]